MAADPPTSEAFTDELYTLVFIITAAVAAYIYLGPLPAMIFTAVAVTAYLLWRGLRFGGTISTDTAVPALLLLTALQLAAYGEMIAFHFAAALSALAPAALFGPTGFTEGVFIIAFPLIMMSVSMFAAIGLMRRRPIAFFVLVYNALWSILMGAVVYGAPALGGESGLLPGYRTAWAPLAAGIVVLFLIIFRRAPRAGAAGRS